MNIQDSQETNSFDSYNVHFKNKIACKQSNFEKKNHSHKTNVDVQQRLKRQKYSLLKNMSYPKMFAGNILILFLVNINCQILRF